MTRTYKAQKAGLTRVVNKLNAATKAQRDALGRDRDVTDKAIREAAAKVLIECRKTVSEWYNEWDPPYWPDDWHRWNIALGDAAFANARADGHGCYFPSHLEDLR